MIYTQVQKPLIPAQWYEILKLKKVEVIAQLTARNVCHTITTHIMTLKSKLYQHIKKFVQSLTAQFNAIVGDDWTQALQESGKTLKEFKKDLLRKFHPDANGGSQEATTISQIINGWEEPQVDSYADLDIMERIKRAEREWAERERERAERERERERQVECALSKLKTMKNLDEIERYLCSLHMDVVGEILLYPAKDVSEEVKSLSSRIWIHKMTSCRTPGSYDHYDHAKFEREWAKLSRSRSR